MAIRFTAKLILLGCSLLLAAAALIAAGNLALHHPDIQQRILRQISEATASDLTAEKIRISFLPTPGLNAQNVTIVPWNSGHQFQTASLNVSVDLRQILSGRIRPVRLYLFRPQVELKTPATGANWQQVLEAVLDVSPWEQLKHLESVMLRDARLIMGGSDYRMEHTDLTVTPAVADGTGFDIDLSARLKRSRTEIPFTLRGNIQISETGAGASSVDLQVGVRTLPLTWLPALPMTRYEGGHASMDFTLRASKSTALTIEGRAKIVDLGLTLTRREQRKTYRIAQAGADFSVRYHNGLLELAPVVFDGPDFQIRLSSSLDFTQKHPSAGPTNPYLQLDIQAPALSLDKFKALFPAPLLPRWLETHLFPIFDNGFARLDSFQLNGTIAQLKRLDQRKNAGTLALELALIEMDALGGRGGMTVNGVSGQLSIHTGRLTATDISGHFGHSSFRNGTLEFPSLYRRSALFHLFLDGKFDLADIHRQGQLDLLPRGIGKTLQAFSSLNGQGETRLNMTFASPHWVPSIIDSSFAFRNAVLARETWPYTLDLPAFKVDLDADGMARFQGEGSWGQTTFEITGRGDHGWNPFPPDSFSAVQAELSLSTDLSQLFEFRDQGLLPRALTQQLSRVKTLQGPVTANGRIHYRPQAGFADVHYWQAHMQNTRMTLDFDGHPIDLDQGVFTIDADNLQTFHAQGHWGKTAFDMVAETREGWQKFNARLEGSFHPEEVWSQIWPRAQFPVTFNGSDANQLQVLRQPDQWHFQGDIGLSKAVLQTPGLTVHPAAEQAKLKFDVTHTSAKPLHIRKAVVEVGASRIAITGSYQPNPHPGLDLSIAAAPLFLDDFKWQTDQLTGPATGMLRCHLEGRMAWGATAESRLAGHLSAHDLTVHPLRLAAPIHAPALYISFNGDEATLDADQLLIGDNRFDIQAQLSGWQGLEGKITATADTMVLDNLLKILRDPDPDAPPGIPGDFAEHTDLKIFLEAKNTQWKELPWGVLSAEMRYRAANLYLRDARFQMPEGLIRIKGRIKAPPQAGFFMQSYFKISDDQLTRLNRIMGVENQRIQGRLSLEGALFSQGQRSGDLAANLTGGINVDIQEGVINQSSVLLEILEFLSLQKMVFKRPTDLTTEGFYFKHFQGHVSASQGVFRTEALMLRSPVLNAVVSGSADLKTRLLDAEIAVQPLGTVDLLISKLPIIGHILTGEDKAIWVYRFTAVGPMAHPKVTYVPFKKLGENTAGYVKRLLLTPDRLFKKMTSVFSELKAGNAEVTMEEWLPEPNQQGP